MGAGATIAAKGRLYICLAVWRTRVHESGGCCGPGIAAV